MILMNNATSACVYISNIVSFTREEKCTIQNIFEPKRNNEQEEWLKYNNNNNTFIKCNDNILIYRSVLQPNIIWIIIINSYCCFTVFRPYTILYYDIMSTYDFLPVFIYFYSYHFQYFFSNGFGLSYKTTML